MTGKGLVAMLGECEKNVSLEILVTWASILRKECRVTSILLKDFTSVGILSRTGSVYPHTAVPLPHPQNLCFCCIQSQPNLF